MVNVNDKINIEKYMLKILINFTGLTFILN